MGEFVKVAETEEIRPGQMKLVALGRRPIVVANVDGEFFAFHDICPHEGESLHRGVLWGDEIDCPRHHYLYNVRTGENRYPRTIYPPEMRRRYAKQVRPMRTYRVRVVGRDVLVERPDPPRRAT